MKLAVGKEYNLNNLKAVKVTDEFLKLDRATIGCQNTKSIQDCKTKEYIESLIMHIGTQVLQNFFPGRFPEYTKSSRKLRIYV